MSIEVILAAVGAAIGTGGIGAIIQAFLSHRAGVRNADVEEQATAVEGFRALVEDLRKEVVRLKEDRAEDRERLTRIEDQIKVERDLKWSAITYIRHLHVWIMQHLRDVDPPPVPDDLAPHVVIPSRKDHTS